MPKELQECTNSWRDLCRMHGWTYKLWSEKDLFNLPLENLDTYKSLWNIWHKTDVARIEIIKRFGGVYLDCDFKWSGQNPEKFIPMSSNHAVVTLEHVARRPKLKVFPEPTCDNNVQAITFSVAFLAAPPKNAFVCKLVKDIKQVVNDNAKQVEAYDLTGCGFWYASWNDPVTVIPMRWLYAEEQDIDHLAKNQCDWRSRMTAQEKAAA